MYLGEAVRHARQVYQAHERLLVWLFPFLPARRNRVNIDERGGMGGEGGVRQMKRCAAASSLGSNQFMLAFECHDIIF